MTGCLGKYAKAVAFFVFAFREKYGKGCAETNGLADAESFVDSETGVYAISKAIKHLPQS